MGYPDHLRKGLNALSGLFYVADEQYESLYNASRTLDKMPILIQTPVNQRTAQSILIRCRPFFVENLLKERDQTLMEFPIW